MQLLKRGHAFYQMVSNCQAILAMKKGKELRRGDRSISTEGIYCSSCMCAFFRRVFKKRPTLVSSEKESYFSF